VFSIRALSARMVISLIKLITVALPLFMRGVFLFLNHSSPDCAKARYSRAINNAGEFNI